MKERLHELMMEATKDMPQCYYWPGEYVEKFAELIVRECAKVLTQHGTYFSGEGEPYHYAASLIEEHFGVEE